MNKLSIKICMFLFIISFGQKAFAENCYQYTRGQAVNIGGVPYCYCGAIASPGCWCTQEIQCDDPCQ